ncbi:MAG: enoyl-CoA hydratase/isomerase family protein, partial [Bacteroidetes bacterium]|nr:enoyl-CoA hydratase/isomerase family protein [Bacteroidota bacterium]
MGNFKNLKTKNTDGIFTITISRPEKMNALNVETVEEIRMAMKRAYDEDEIKGVIITGEGDKAFIAGADISEIGGLNEVNGRKFSENGQEVFAMIENSHKPVIAAVNGYALGGGCELAMACHMRVASDNAKFGQPEVGLGIIPGYGGTQRLTQLVGKGKANELMMTGDMISADLAKELGLVNYVTSKDELIPKCEEMLKKIFSKAPLAVGLVIDCVNAVFDGEVNGYQLEADSF